jgi:tetratricopeptide (TPR) repeat protein
MTESSQPNFEEILDEIRKLAKKADKEDRQASVIELLHGYLKLRPSDGYMWYIFGDALRIIGLNDEAERALNTALELCPEKRGWILTRLARLQNSAGRYAEAENSYAQACTDPKFADVGWLWIMRGANLASATQLRAAEHCHRRALTFHDEHVDRDEAYLNLGYVLRAQGRYAEAADAFQNALEITPDDSEALEARASLVGIDEALAKGKQLES